MHNIIHNVRKPYCRQSSPGNQIITTAFFLNYALHVVVKLIPLTNAIKTVKNYHENPLSSFTRNNKVA